MKQRYIFACGVGALKDVFFVSVSFDKEARKKKQRTLIIK